jgi:hypothetical protein
VDVLEPPAVKLAGIVATIAKFGNVTALTLNVTVVVGDREPLDPVTVTITAPADVNVHESVAVPEPVTVAGLTEHAALLAERLTTPLNWLSADIVIVEVPAAFVFTGTVVGFAAIVNPTTWKRIEPVS